MNFELECNFLLGSEPAISKLMCYAKHLIFSAKQIQIIQKWLIFEDFWKLDVLHKEPNLSRHTPEMTPHSAALKFIFLLNVIFEYQTKRQSDKLTVRDSNSCWKNRAIEKPENTIKMMPECKVISRYTYALTFRMKFYPLHIFSTSLENFYWFEWKGSLMSIRTYELNMIMLKILIYATNFLLRYLGAAIMGNYCGTILKANLNYNLCYNKPVFIFFLWLDKHWGLLKNILLKYLTVVEHVSIKYQKRNGK